MMWKGSSASVLARAPLGLLQTDLHPALTAPSLLCVQSCVCFPRVLWVLKPSPVFFRLPCPPSHQTEKGSPSLQVTVVEGGV